MINAEQLGAVVEDLIEALHLQAKELEKLVTHVEQVAPRLGYTPQFSVVSAKFAELHRRVQKLREPHAVS